MSTSEASGNGPAFPFVEYDGDGAPYNTYVGMSLRDYFAAKAMLALLTIDGTTYFSNRAKEAYDMADAMLAAREAK